MKAALYTRVSSEHQALEGFSLVAQIKALREYCSKNDIDIYKEYADEGLSAKDDTVNKRPAMKEMLADGEKGMFQMILVHKYDRFARNVELSQKIKKQLAKSNISLVSITEPLEDSPMGFFVGGMHDLMSEYFIRNLSREVMKGMNERAQEGKHMGQMPYGYYLENKTIKVNENEAQIVRKVFELYNEGYGTNKISRYLNDHRVQQQKGGYNWSGVHALKILKRKAYIGKLEWNGNVYDGCFPPIIDDELFNSTQFQLEKKGTTYTKRKKHFNEFLLLGVLRCAECGSMMRVKKSNGGTCYSKWIYVCQKADNNNKICTHITHHNIDKIESVVENQIFEGLVSTYDFAEYEKHIDNSDILVQKLNKVNRDLEKALQCFYNEVFTIDEYKEQKEKLNAIKEEIEAELNRNSKDKANLSKMKFEKKIMSIKDKYYASNIIEKKNMITSVIKSIEVGPNGDISIIIRPL